MPVVRNNTGSARWLTKELRHPRTQSMSNNRLTIFINQKFPDEAANALLAKSLAGHDVVYSKSITTSNLAASSHDSVIDTANVAFGQPDPAALIAAPKLKWAHLTSAGYDRYDREDLRAAMKARGGMITNSSSVYEEPCAEHLVAMMLSLARQLPVGLANQREAKAWPSAELRKASRLLVGQTVVLLSFGAIVRRVVELLAPYRMNLIAVRRSPTGKESIRTISENELDAVLPQADHVLNILPGGTATKGYVSAKRFGLMKMGCHFYNIGRGGTVDQAALLESLQSERLAGAYLDVTDPEPLPVSHGLWSAPNCYITPHTAGGHHDEFERLVRHFLENLARYEKAEKLKDVVI
jgi:phosphoglycerate dehydrogenase-like enzyme